jgi:tetratricopeptide (TPR) repeat protein
VGTNNTEAFTAFQAAEALRKEENDTGLEAAIEKYKQAIDLDPRYAQAQTRLAWAYLRHYGLHQDPAALTLAGLNCKSAIQLDPTLADAHVGLASVYRQTGEDENAAREMSRAISLDPSNAHTLVNQGDFYAMANRWDEAEATFNRVLNLRPNYWLAHNEWGAVLEDQGKYPRALLEFRTASLAAPKNAFALKNVGAVYRRLGKLPEALEALNASFAMKQDDQTAENLAETFRVQKKYTEALDYAQKAVKFNPNDASYWLELGDVYSSTGRFRAEAEDAYRRATIAQERELQTSPKDGRGWMLLALCHAKTGNNETALTLIPKAESLHADDITSQLFKVRILELAGRHDDALSTIARCVNRGPTLFQVQTLPDIERLRSTPEFRRTVASAQSPNQTSA